jgi:serine/threonine-protein kinase
MFRAASPQEARGRTITARELLDRGRDRVDKELAGEPDVRASLLYNIAQSYSRLGFYDRAKEMAERSYEIRKQALGPPAVAELRHRVPSQNCSSDQAGIPSIGI